MSNKKSSSTYTLAAAAIIMIALLLAGVLLSSNMTAATDNTYISSLAERNEAGDLLIPVSAISETVTFYQVQENGITLEVLAAQAPDGSVRTAFNTCQICYNSGRGYYVQEGETLICQNCGNRYPMDQVSVQKGGCNPVPIFEDERIDNGEIISIPGSLLEETSVIFTDWKAF